MTTGIVALVPWLREVPGLPGPAARVVDLAFASLCHHIPARVLSLHDGQPMCVCSRCAGLYLGLAVGFLFPSPRYRDRTYRALLATALGLAALDVVSQDAGLHPPLHTVRLLTGALLGWAVAAWIARVTGRPRVARTAPQLG